MRSRACERNQGIDHIDQKKLFEEVIIFWEEERV